MRVTLLLFAALRERVGVDRLTVDLPEGATVQDLRSRAESLQSNIRSVPYLVARNRSYAPPDAVLREGDELAFLPPVSGG